MEMEEKKPLKGEVDKFVEERYPHFTPLQRAKLHLLIQGMWASYNERLKMGAKGEF
jgi:hypothetical protein